MGTRWTPERRRKASLRMQGRMRSALPPEYHLSPEQERARLIIADEGFRRALARERPQTGPSHTAGTKRPRTLNPATRVSGASSSAGW